ncbi:MAG: NUDIX hydrolase [Oscillospiraceae bacterium]|nr:NUDIX hydrolase [Oscillospiraceae bacterium]
MSIKSNKKDDKLIEKTISSQQVYDGCLLKIYRDEVLLPDGNTSVREYNKHPGAVCVVPITEDNHILMVRQYRYSTRQIMLEIPAGKLEKGETPLENCKRELEEETGAQGYSFITLGGYIGLCAYSDELVHMYMCRVKDFGEQHLDDDEFLTVEKIPFDKAVEMVLNNQIADGKTQVAILKAKYLLDSGKI